MKSPLAAHFSSRRSRSARVLASASTASLLLVVGQSAPAATTYVYNGGTTGVWSTSTVWTPNGLPTTGDTASFAGSASQTVLLGGNQAALDLSFVATNFSAVRASAAGNTLTLGASGGTATGAGGIQFGSAQTDLGGSGVNTMVISLAGSQFWTGTVGGGLIQLNTGVTATTTSITNGSGAAATLTFDGVSTGSKTVTGAIVDGTAPLTIALATTGTFGTLNLNGANTYTGGTTFTSGFLGLGNNTALGTGALNVVNNGSTHQISAGQVGGVTLTNNNALNLNAAILLTGSQNIDFGTGAVTLGSATTFTLGSTNNPTVFTFGGNITGGFGLTTSNNNGGLTDSLVNFNGTNSPTGAINVNGGAVRFGSSAAVPAGTGTVVLGGGAIAVGSGTAFAGATPIATFLADTRVTKTQGTVALTGDSSENFTPPNGNIALGAALGSFARYTGTITPSGTNYNIGGGGGTLVLAGANTLSGARSVAFGGTGGGGTTVITGQNNYTGTTTINQGTVEVSSINRVTGGTATSNLGAPSSAANGTLTFGGGGSSYLRYVGPGETTDRGIVYNQGFNASMGLDASGTGAVDFAGTYSPGGPFGTNNSLARTIAFRGVDLDANKFEGNITSPTNSSGTSSTNNTSLLKQQRGNWTLTGANNLSGTTFGGVLSTGSVTVNGGTLTADYATNATVLGFTTTAPTLNLGGGTLAIKGNAAGGTTQTLGTTVLTASTGQSNVTVSGTAGTTNLTLGNTFTRNGGTFLNFNLTGGGQVTASPSVSTNVVVGSSNVAAFTVSDGAGTDFATVSSGQIAKLNAATPLPTATGANTTNYVLTVGQTQTASTAINTLRIVPGMTATTLDLAGFSLTTGLGAVSVLKDGANASTITGTVALAGGAASVIVSNFGTGGLTLSVAPTTGSGSFNKTGPGLVDLTVASTYTGATNIFGGVLRASNGTFAANSNIVLNTGGILELGGFGNFSRALGTNGGQIQWGNGDGGFSASGATRTVLLTNSLLVPTTQLTWGSTSGNNFVTAPNTGLFVKDGQALLLSSATATGTLDFQNPIDFVNAPRAVEVGDGSQAVDAILSGVLSSSDFSGGLYKTGAGTLALTGANTYTGQTSIIAGTLQVGNGGTTGTLGNGGNVVNNANLAFNRTDAAPAVANVISGTGTLTQAGTGSTILTAANTYTGATTISAGTLQLGNAGITGSLSTSSAIVDNGNLTINRTNAVVQGTDFSGAAITGSGSFTQAGTGMTTLNVANTYAGGTALSGGTLLVGNNNALGSGNLTVTGADSLGASTSGISLAAANNVVLSTTGVLTLTGANTLTINGSVTNSGAGRTLNNAITTGTTTLAGNVYLSENNTQGRTLTIGSGATASPGTTLISGVIANNSSTNTAASNLIVGGGGTNILTGANTYTGTTTVQNASTVLQVGNGGTTGNLGAGEVVLNTAGKLSFNRSDAVTVSNNLTGGTGSLSQIGSGTTTLTGTNTYTGSTTISAGTLQIGGAGTTGSLGSGNVIDNAALAFNRTDSVTIANAISGSGTLTQAGSGIVTLTAANSYGGATNVNAGTLVIAGNQSGTGQINVTDATLQFGNGTLNGSAASAAVVVNNTSTVNLNFADTGSISNAITSNSGVTTLSGTNAASTNNTFVGAATSNGGSFTTLSTNANATLTFSGSPTAFDIKGTTLNINGAGNTLISGAIANNTGPGNVVKNGTGTATLTGVNTYDGGTTVSAGTLLVNNASGSGTGTGGVVVNNTGTLGGTGTISGATTVNAGGTITGATNGSVGQLTLQNNVAFVGAESSLAIYVVDLNDTTADKLAIGGTLDLSTTFDQISFNALATPIASKYVLATYTGSLNGNIFDVMTNVPSGYTVDYSTPGEIDLITAVPEPGTVAAGLLAFGTLGFSQRRRVRQWLGTARLMKQAA